MPYLKSFAIISCCLLSSLPLASQITPNESISLLRRLYNKELTYYRSVQYICQEKLKVEHNQLADVSMVVETAAKSGELTTVVYHSDAMNQQGLVFVFWQDQVTHEMQNNIDGYGFKTFDLGQANNFLSRISDILEDKRTVLENDNHAVFQFEEVTFIFRDRTTIFVCYEDFNSEWTVANLKLTINRVNKFLSKKNK